MASFLSYRTALLALCLAPWCALWGQGTLSDISGNITSQDQAPLPGVEVSAVNTATGQVRKASTDTHGNYTISALPAGTYTVRAELMDFRTMVREGVVLRVAEPGRADFAMEIGEIQQSVTVVESQQPLRTQSAEVGEVMANQRFIGLPLNGRRFTDLMLLSDNVVAEPRGTRGAALGQTGPTVAIAGQRGGHNMYYLDGVSVTDQYFNNLTVSLSVDALQEFNIQKSIYPAEYGGKASAAISAATRSGGNAMHGSLYEFLRNSALDSRNFFDGATKPPLRQNQFGGTFGGAARKDRTFYFLSTEAVRERRSLTNTFSLPSAAVRSGDFSGLPQIYDPLTVDPATGRRQPFANNRIPLDRIDPIARAFLQKIPMPTSVGEVQNFRAAPGSRNDNTQATVRIDHSIRASDTLFARYTWSDSETLRPFGSSDLNEVLVPGFGTFITTASKNLSVGHTHLFRPNLLHEFRFGWLQVAGGQRLENQGAPFAASAGLQGVTSDPSQAGYPAINFGGAYSSLGDPARAVRRDNTSLDFFSNTSWVLGSHKVKFGGYFYRLYFRPQDAPNVRGAFGFTPRFSSSAAGLSDGSAFADFLLGYPSQAQTGLGRGSEDARTNWIHAYLQDDWHATRNVTINAGLRYEFNRHITDVGNRLSNLQQDRLIIASDNQGRMSPDAQALLPSVTVPYLTSQAAGYHRSLLRPGLVRLAPRFGIAWSPRGSTKTVLRAGFGLFFNQWAYSVQTLLMQNLPFFYNKSVTTAADQLRPTLSTGTILLSPATGTMSGGGMDQNYRSEYAESWNLSVQRLLPGSVSFEASYFGSKVVGADDSTFYNVPLPGPGSISARRPNPNLSAFQVIHWGGYSWYHALNLKLERRLMAGVAVNANYTWSKATDVASSPGPTFSETNFPQDVYNRRAEYALSSFDHRHRLATSFTWQLPKGFALQGLATMQTGAPFTVNLPTDNANIGAGPAQRPDVLSDPNISTRTPGQWFDTRAFVMPKQFTFGNAGRNLVFGDGTVNLDVSAQKIFRLNENASLQLRGEIFNVLNNTNFADAPGRIAFTPSFGRYFSAENPRQVQIALKLLF
ncbi:MAG: TonB-dependent receptor [Bryobacteraceae bacterium]